MDVAAVSRRAPKPMDEARARVLERRDIREAIGVGAPVAIATVGASLLLFAAGSPGRSAIGVMAIVAIASIWALSRGRLRRRPHVAAFTLVMVILVCRLLPIVFEVGLADLTAAYFGLIVVTSAVILPWNLRWHGTWLLAGGSVYVAAAISVPAMSPIEPHDMVFVATAMVASALGSILVRTRRDRQHATQMALRAERAELRLAHAQLREAAQNDPLTGLLNRRRLDEDIAMLESRFSRGMTGLAALMVDLDAFKEYNDALGHHEGDRVLSACAAATRGAVRSVDRVYRYGGEEFLVLLDEDDGDGAQIAACRIVEAVRALHIPHPRSHDVQMTVSVGSAASNGLPVGPWDVIDEADRALYAAKAAGRDRSVQFRLNRPVRAGEHHAVTASSGS